MSATMLAAQMEEALAGLPLFDIHTHLVGGRLGARGEPCTTHRAGQDAGVMRPPQAESDQADAKLPGFRHGIEARGLWHRGTAIQLESGATPGRTVF